MTKTSLAVGVHFLCVSALALFTSACGPAALSLAGGGASAATSYTINGIAYRTFSIPKAKVHRAALNALDRMNIKPSQGKNQGTESITAKAGNRSIEIDLEVITPNLTRMQVTAKSNPIFTDRATATEIIEQTARSLNEKRA